MWMSWHCLGVCDNSQFLECQCCCADTLFFTKGFKIYGQGFPVLTSAYITFLWEYYFVGYTLNILNSILLHNTCILLMFVGHGTDQLRGQLKSEEFYCSLQDCNLSRVIFVSWKINWIFENQDICIFLLHGFNGTAILQLEPVELTFVSVYTWSYNKVRKLITVKVLPTSLLNTTMVTFKVLPLGSYAPMPAPSPPFKTILELVLWNGLQRCSCITLDVIKMPSFQYFLYLREQEKVTGG